MGWGMFQKIVGVLRFIYRVSRSKPVEICIVLTILLHILPIWLFRYYPTQDGPCHLANAIILKEYHQHQIYQEYFQLNLKPASNWFSHITLAVLMYVVPPLIAEKILITLYAVLFPFSIFYFIDAVHKGRRLLGFIGFLFMYNYMLHMGSYNFAFSMPVLFFCVGYWWKHREAFHWRRLLILNLLFIFTYFCHIVSQALAIATILLLAAVTTRRSNLKSRLLLPFAMSPSYLLPLWYLFYRQGNASDKWPLGQLCDYFTQIRSVATFGEQDIVPQLLAWLLIAIFIYTIVERFNLFRWDSQRKRFQFRFQASDAFYLIFALLAGAYFTVPDIMTGSGLISARLCLYPFIALLPALSQEMRRPFQWVFGLAIITLVVVQLHMNIKYYRTLSADLEEYTSGIGIVQRNKTFLSLSFNHGGSLPGNRIDVFVHAIGYYAAERRGVGLDNFEVFTGYFPIRCKPAFQQWLDYSDLVIMESNPAKVDVNRYGHRLDYVVTWAMPLDLPVSARIQEHYQQVYVSERQRLRIFARKEAPVNDE